jgi:hypothetical protein
MHKTHCINLTLFCKTHPNPSTSKEECNHGTLFTGLEDEILLLYEKKKQTNKQNKTKHTHIFEK